MRRWFLSYHSPDRALAKRLKAAIERKDYGSRVFFAPAHIRAGGSWTAQLAKEIADATAFILLVGENGVGPWQVLEYDEALDKRVTSPDFPVILVLLDSPKAKAPGLPFLRRLHWIVTPDPASEDVAARLIDAAAGGEARPGELWRYTNPYRGLAAMEEKDSDYFFGRSRETVAVLKALAAPGRIPVLIGNSGVGKSSLAQAGVLAALKRQAWPQMAPGEAYDGALSREAPGESAPDASPQMAPGEVLGVAPEAAAREGAWPHVFRDSRQWCFLTLKPGTDPLRALVDAFLDCWQFDAIDPERVRVQNGWIELLRDDRQKHPLGDLIDATGRRQGERGLAKPPVFFLYVDQGEELYVRAEERQRRRFSQILAGALADPRLRIMVSMRSDFLGDLQRDEPLFEARAQIDVPPLREAALRQVVSRPAELLAARFETQGLIDIITRRTAEDSVKDVGALPLLSYTLDDMWAQMVAAGDGTLRLAAQSFEPGGVLVARADIFLATHPGAEDDLKRVMTLRCATVREDGEPTRRRAPRGEFSEAEWSLVSELADHPNRLLVTAVPEAGGEAYAEVAHEAVFRRWGKLREWIAAERGFLAWRSGVEAARRAWQATPDRSKNDALLMGLALEQARTWSAKRLPDIPRTDQDFIRLSQKHRHRQHARAVAVVGTLCAMLAVASIYAVWAQWVLVNVYARTEKPETGRVSVQWALASAYVEVLSELLWPKVLSEANERALKPAEFFTECTHCPLMVVVPPGTFMMGSSGPAPKPYYENEQPRHLVTIAKRFAVSRFEVTFEEWDNCVLLLGCSFRPGDQGWGRGKRPVINVDWDDAQGYVRWLSRRTGKQYRLLTEAEWEYAARAGSESPFAFGDSITGRADCDGCGSKWDNKQTAPVGSFIPNAFGLYDMHGNVWEWVEDCYQPNYNSAPSDGSAVTAADCSNHVLRGGSWYNGPQNVRSAVRDFHHPGLLSDGLDSNRPDTKTESIGFRVARMLLPAAR